MTSPRHTSPSNNESSICSLVDTSALPEALVVPVLELFEGKHLELPILPPSVAKLILVCGSGKPDIREVAKLVGSDPSLTAHILRMANSAALAPQHPISSTSDAVCRLGTRAIADLAVNNMVHNFAMGQDHRRTLELFRHASVASVFSFQLGLVIGPACRASPLPGLLNDIGRPLATNFLTDLRGIVPGSIDESTLDLLAEDLHEAIGIQLVRSWNLPKSLELVIRYHSRPHEAGPEIELRDAHIAELSNLLANWTIDPESTSGVVLKEHNATLALGLTSDQIKRTLSVIGDARQAATALG